MFRMLALNNFPLTVLNVRHALPLVLYIYHKLTTGTVLNDIVLNNNSNEAKFFGRGLVTSIRVSHRASTCMGMKMLYLLLFSRCLARSWNTSLDARRPSFNPSLRLFLNICSPCQPRRSCNEILYSFLVQNTKRLGMPIGRMPHPGRVGGALAFKSNGPRFDSRAGTWPCSGMGRHNV